MDKRFWAIVGIIVVLFIGFVAVKNNDKAAAPASAAKPTNNVRGKLDSKVTLIEYGDFQCPACGQYYPIVEQVYTKYADKVKFQFRNFPLTSLHPNAFAGSRAAEAAAKQNKFWDMYNKLYSNQTEWAQSSNPNKLFEGYAKSIGLNIAQYQADFKSKSVNDAVRADMDAGDKLGANSTPTFVLNGTKIENPNPTVEAFSKVLDKALERS
jgi:protein-disulfide isomerase